MPAYFQFKKIGRFLKKIGRFLASLQLAILVLLSLTVLCVLGTFYESFYNAEVARKWIYDSIWFELTLALLAINLISVMVHRWPWRVKHLPFLSAHVGIVVLMLGFVATSQLGIDGSMRLAPGEPNHFVTIPQRVFSVYSHFGEGNYRLLLEKEVDFLKAYPKKPDQSFLVQDENIQLLDFCAFCIPKRKFLKSDDSKRWHVSLNLKSSRGDWKREFLTAYGVTDLIDVGLMRIVLSSDKKVKLDKKIKNQLHLRPTPKALEVYKYENGVLKFKKTAQKGQRLALGWMDLKLHVRDFLPAASQELSFEKRDFPQEEVTTEGVKVSFLGRQKWLSLGAPLYFYDKDKVYVVSYGYKNIPINFELTLDKMNVKFYPGAKQAKAYESLVDVTGIEKPQLIYMNNPLKYKGLTFYQSSYEKDEQGQIEASILTVNYDTGRWVKYIGSFFVVLGMLLLFYFRKNFNFTGKASAQKGS